jgi:hypothetical protein
MSRFVDHYDDDSPDAVLAQGRWQHNARVALKGKRGRKALAELREALMALPQHRLIDSAVCTVGGLDKRAPELTDADVARYREEYAARWPTDDQFVGRWAESRRGEREEERERLAEQIRRQGEGVCAIGAYLWYQRVKAGAGAAEAFDAVPTVFGVDGSDPLDETAHLGRDAGLTFTLAWELAYRNDETYERMTPEERWEAFVAWIDRELAETTVAA